MISVEQWRAVIGCFSPRRRKALDPVTQFNSAELKRLFRHRRVAVLFVVGAMLMMCGDVESNPGPPKKILQSKLDASFSSSSTPNTSDVMAAITNLGVKFDTKFAEFDIKVNDIVSALDTLREGNSLLKKRVEKLTEETGQLKERLEKTEKKLEELEGRSRRNNLIFHGLPPAKDIETWDDCERLVKKCITEKLGLVRDEIQFDRVHRIGSSIIAKFTFFKDKERVMKERRKLKGSKIFVNEDYTLGVREIRKKLSPFMNWFRSENKRASLVFDHLVVDGERFDFDFTSNSVISKRDNRRYELPHAFTTGAHQHYQLRGDRRENIRT